MNFTYPENLPVTACRQKIIETIRRHQVVVIAGDTGSGKTTQLAKMCLEAFADSDPLVGCTQPRRIAATSVSQRVADELGASCHLVGYKIRFHDQTSAATRIKFMTDGVLLAETRQDRLLKAYQVIIVDEAHERSLNIDFLLGYLRRLLDRRGDLKVIITSATIDTEAFSRHFNDAPVITITGRNYPVRLLYHPPPEEAGEDRDGIIDHCVNTVAEICRKDPLGDILVFLPTERDIRECCELLAGKVPHSMVLPLYGRLPLADQRRIFQPGKARKIVVATNVAETSITVPGICTVVDAGLARISQYNPRAKTTSLPIVPISRAASAQRAGRCGRTGPGLCLRLYSEEDFNDRPEYTEPELKRANLAEVVLQMIALGLGTPEEFPFIDPPGKQAIREGYQLLRELGAINGMHRLTDRGKMMAGLPIDPCISRIILEAGALNCLREIKIIAAALAIQDPRNRPPGQEKEAAAAQEVFAHSQSDFIGLLNIWTQCHQGAESGHSLSRLKKFCKNHYLSFQRMREWIDLHEQLCRITSRLEGLRDNSTDASYQQIHQALLSGFVRNIAVKKQGRLYQGASNRELMIFPGSHQFHRGGQWLVAAAFLETNRLYALTVATIEAEWVEAAAGHLCNFSWGAVRWHKKTGQVLADERVALFGLILVAGRQVNFPTRHRKNIALAREVFIAAALVEGEINGSYDFLTKNQALLDKWREAEEKLRTRSIVIDQTALYNWYAARLPADVYDQRSLNRFLRGKPQHTSLMMGDSDVLLRVPEDKELIDFPEKIAIGRMEVRLEYLFQPGSPRDGVTFRLPVDFARTVSADSFEWLVPGLLEEKIHFLLRSLAKGIRKKLVPLRETVLLLLDDIDQGQGSLLTALETSVMKKFRLHVRRSDWPTTLPDHLRPHFVLVNSCGEELSAGRDLATLLGGTAAPVPTHAPVFREKDQELIGRWQGSEHSCWNFAGLPASLPFSNGAGDVAGFYYPMLMPKPEKGCVRIEFTPNRQKALETTFQGNLYLYSLQFSDQARAFKKYSATAFSGPATLWLEKNLTSRQEVVESLRRAVFSSLFSPLSGEIVDQQIFQETLSRVQKGGGLYRLGRQLSDQLLALLRKRRDVAELIGRVCGPGPGRPAGDPQNAEIFNEHLQAVFPVETLFSGSSLPFTDIDRQLQGLRIRLDRFHADPGKDRKKSLQISGHLENLKKLANPPANHSEEMRGLIVRYRQLINEFRISLFAPEIKTAEPVSPAKLNELWRSIQARI